MKIATAPKLILIIFIITLGIKEVRSQASFEAASNSIADKKFYFSGTVEGVVFDIATINFSIYEEGKAILEVLDLQGNLISELVRGDMQKGEYLIYYKPESDLPFGEYFLRFEMNGESRIERFLKGTVE